MVRRDKDILYDTYKAFIIGYTAAFFINWSRKSVLRATHLLKNVLLHGTIIGSIDAYYFIAIKLDRKMILENISDQKSE